VLPSVCEAMPMCVLEAMAAGKSVIASRVGMVPKMVVPAHTGVLVEPGDIDGLSAAIIELLKNPEHAHQLGENGCVRATEHFSSSSMAMRYMQLYQEVLGVRAGSNRKAIAWGVN